MSTKKNTVGRPKKYGWVYVSIETVRKSDTTVYGFPGKPLDATSRAVVKSIVSKMNRGHDRKIRPLFADKSVHFGFKPVKNERNFNT